MIECRRMAWVFRRQCHISTAAEEAVDFDDGIDALRVVSEGVNALRDAKRSFMVITHYQRLLEYIVPDYVHVLVNGEIVESGDKTLALQLEEKGYADFRGEETGAARSA